MKYEREHVAFLKRRLEETPRRIQTLFGPRQSGKTTIVVQALRTLAKPWRYYAVDSPDNDATSSQLRQPEGKRRSPAAPRDRGWLIDVWVQARAEAESYGGSVLVFDELQYIPDWSSTVKGLWDRDRREECPLHVVILGSAPMSIQSSLNESMAGRFEVIDVRHWSFGEMKAAFGLDLDQYIYFGGYPGAMRLADRWPPDWRDYEPRWHRYVKTSFVGPAIERDVLAMTRVDKPALLRRLFELGAAYSGQILPLHRMLGELQDAGNATTLARYLDLLSRIGLLTGLQKYSPSVLRLRNSPPKFNVLDTALMSVESNRTFEYAKADRRFWGRLVESAVGAHLLNTCGPATRVLYWRDASDEVDFVLQSGFRTVAIEVKTGSRVRPATGLRIFKERFRPHRTLLVTESGEPPGSVPLEVFLSRPASVWFRSEFVLRACVKIGEGKGPEEAPKPLAEFDSAPAYVLLGDPGMGKTTCFREACRNLGEQAQLISARDFITFDCDQHPEWRRKTLFIDGLDEVRAGTEDARVPLDAVRRQLDRMGRPDFRLSCREADWLGENDRGRLEAVAPDGKLAVLRLHPLTDEDAVKVAESRFYLEDGQGFLDTARQKGLGDLIRNPQNVELLAAGVRAGEWPENRGDLFELACRRLAAEPNQEHLNASLRRSAPDQLLEAAGRICSLLLLSGTAGVRLSSSATDAATGYKPTDLVDPPPPAAAAGETEAWRRQQRAALSTRLFRAAAEAQPAERCFEPAHRHIAEFLAGRYLARRIEDGLPAARVVSMVTARDGGVATTQRGLAAWLAAHSKAARSQLIERDPIGVGLYGDLTPFASNEKQLLIEALTREGRRLHSLSHRAAAAFAPLASPALEAELRARLSAIPYSDDDQLSTEFVLNVLRHGRRMPSLARPILAVVYEPTWWPRVAFCALEAFVEQRADVGVRNAELRKLLTAIHEDAVSDPDNELMGRVLDRLYPDAIPPAEIWGHLALSKPTKLIGRHRVFWSQRIEERTPDAGIPDLMDALARHASELRSVLSKWEFPVVVIRLLARALRSHGGTAEPARIYDWLSAPADNHEPFWGLDNSPKAREHLFAIRRWLEEHPAAFKAALLEGLLRCADDDDLHGKALRISMRFHGAEPPDFGAWNLEQARALADSHPALAQLMFRQAQHRLNYGETSHGLSQELLDECLQEHPEWRPSPAPKPEPQTGNELRETAWRRDEAGWANPTGRATQSSVADERERRRKQWLKEVRAEVPALRENRGNPALLHDLASEWFQGVAWSRESLLECLSAKFGAEDDLAAAAYEGLLGVIERDDVPDESEILRLRGESRMSWLARPFLATLEDRDRQQDEPIGLDEDKWRVALAFHYCVPVGRNFPPRWYRRLIAEDPELVASVFLPFARTELRKGREHVAGFPELVHDEDHAELARLVSLPLLRSFPVRCPGRQFPDLMRLLWTALRYADRRKLLELIQKKLSGRSMTVGQRVHWLAAGLLAAPETFADPLDRFVDGKELRGRQLANFLRFEELFRPEDAAPDALEVLIRQLGLALGPIELEDGPEDEGQWTVWHLPDLIRQLTTSPGPKAAAALHRLANDERLSHWRHHLRMAYDRRVVADRDASYELPALEAVRATLNNAAPTNAADLAALVLDRVDELARTIRHSNTNHWRQFWNEDEYGRPTGPKREEPCRDALLSHLERLLPAEVEAQPEGRYAADRRADIRLSCADFHVPIELKKQSHPALYRAARDQLVARYAQDPATGGHGIFLALWFGDPEKAPLDETGTRPGTPEELRQRLVACLARQLRPQQLRKIAVRVIDVSRP